MIAPMDDAAEIKLSVYRNLDNRNAGQPDDGPMAWDAHRTRRKLLEDTFADDAFVVRDWGATKAEDRPRELVELVIDIIKNPTPVGIALAGGIAILKLLAKPLEKKLEEAVEKIFGRLFSAFRKKEIADFEMRLPDGTVLKCPPGTTIQITLPNGETRTAPAPT